MKLSDEMEQSDLMPEEWAYPEGNPKHQEYIHFIDEVRKLETMVIEDQEVRDE